MLILVAGAIALFTLVICAICDELFRMQRRHIGIIATAGAVITLALVLCALSFRNITHLIACIKHDHVVVVEHRPGRNMPDRPIDASKAICQEEDFGNRLVVMAWNDDKPADTYAKLVK